MNQPALSGSRFSSLRLCRRYLTQDYQTNTPIQGAIFSSAESQGNGAQRSDDF
jgi:hypothetical protein